MWAEVSWMRSNGSKLSPLLRRKVLDLYRPLKRTPCVIYRPLLKLRLRFRKIPVIVQMTDSSRGGDPFRDTACKAGCRIRRRLSLVGGFSTVVTAKRLERLVSDPNVKRIWYDREVRTLLDVAVPTVGAPTVWESDHRGRNVSVAVVDTGIYNHPDLNGRIAAFYDAINARSDPYDDNGHGSHVAGIIGASGESSGGKYRGVAPEATLIGIKALDKYGSGSLSGIIDAVQWCVNNRERFNIRVLSMSLGAKPAGPAADDPLCIAVVAAWEAGIVVCVAAGNSGPNEMTIDSPGYEPRIITVGATDDRNTTVISDDAIADFSGRGPTVDGVDKPELVVPGTNVISLRSPRSYLDKKVEGTRVDDWHTVLSGTSMATPVCSGIVALLLDANPELDPEAVRERILNGCVDLGFEQNAQGRGLLSADRLGIT